MILANLVLNLSNNSRIFLRIGARISLSLSENFLLSLPDVLDDSFNAYESYPNDSLKKALISTSIILPPLKNPSESRF